VRMISQDKNSPVTNPRKNWLEDTKAVMESTELNDSSENESEKTDDEDISCEGNINESKGMTGLNFDIILLAKKF